MQNSNDNMKVVGALLLGAAVGAALGVLFAPNKGSKTRKMLAGGVKDLTDDLGEKIKEQVTSLRNKADNLEETAEGKVTELVHNAKNKVEVLKHAH